MSPEEWKTGEAEERGQFRIFSIKEVQATSPRTGKDLSFYLLECNDWVNVIPLTEAGEVVMIRQYRFGTQQVELEIPGGVIEDGRTPEPAAAPAGAPAAAAAADAANAQTAGPTTVHNVSSP